VDRSTLFAGFAGTIDESDLFVLFIIGYGIRPSDASLGTVSPGRNEDVPVPAQEIVAMGCPKPFTTGVGLFDYLIGANQRR
jgi:hypothetical protein